MMLSSSVCSTISAPELTAAAFIESQTYKPFEVYIVVAVIYLALALCLRAMLALVGRWLFGRRSVGQVIMADVEVRA